MCIPCINKGHFACGREAPFAADSQLSNAASELDIEREVRGAFRSDVLRPPVSGMPDWATGHGPASNIRGIGSAPSGEFGVVGYWLERELG